MLRRFRNPLFQAHCTGAGFSSELDYALITAGHSSVRCGVLHSVFIAHFGAGLAAKRFAPRASLGWLIGAAIFLDLLWPILLLLGWETVRIDPSATAVTPLDFVSYPISHSLLAVAGWAVLAAALYWRTTGYRLGALVIAAAVTSHWVLDLLVHRPDLPLYPRGPLAGLGLWNSFAASFAAEVVCFGLGVWIYARSTTASSNAGRFGWWVFVAFLILVYAMNIFGPRPERVEQVAVVGLTLWLMPVWAWSFDRRRISGLPESRV